MKFKKFRKSKVRMFKAQYELESGNHVECKELLCYTNFFYIEIHKDKKPKELYSKDLYVVNAQDNLETCNLKEAERFLYEAIKSELPKKEKKDKEFSTRVLIDISQSIGFYSSSEWDCELLNGTSDEDKQELAVNLAKEFEKTFNGNEYHETMSIFVMTKFSPKKKDENKFPRGLECWLYTHYQVVEYMGYHQSKYENGKCIHEGSQVIEDLDGQDGKQEFAEMLTTELETKFVDIDFEETPFYDVIDDFINEAFYPNKEFVIKTKVTSYAEKVVTAKSKEEAEKIAETLDSEDHFTPKGNSTMELHSIEEKQ
jgi:hypothetical protein